MLFKKFIKSTVALVVLTSINMAYAQTCNTNIQTNTPNHRYEILNGGKEVKDKLTGLTWQRCNLGQIWNGNTCTGQAIEYDWQNALSKSKALGTGYRLPNVKELKTLINVQCKSPAINASYFPNTESRWYWSSTPYHAVNFREGSDGISQGYYNQNFVRAVKSE